jgi:hypothetical protein
VGVVDVDVIDMSRVTLTEFHATLPLNLLANPYAAPSELGSYEEWGISDALLFILDVWHKREGNAGMSFILKFLEAIQLDNPDEMLLPLTGFRMWEAGNPINPKEQKLGDLKEAHDLLLQWHNLTHSIQPEQGDYFPYGDKIIKIDELMGWDWEEWEREIFLDILSERNKDFELSVMCDYELYTGNEMSISLCHSLNAYIASLFPIIEEYRKFECVRKLYHMGYIPIVSDDPNEEPWLIHAGKKGE